MMAVRNVLIVVLLALTACSRGPGETTTQAGRMIGALTGQRAEAAHQAGTATRTEPKLRGFAALPDHGDLVAYPGNVVRHDGAYTWYRTDVSEQYALRAMVQGRLRVTTPDGGILDFDYDRHIEHASGDWTWIGHLPGQSGEQMILTFGDQAAFGSIAQPGQLPLRLTVRDGASWMVETDPTKVAAIRNAVTRPEKPDYHVVPRSELPHAAGRDNTHGLDADLQSGPTVASVSTLSASSSTSTTVDLLLGYTQGFAIANGGASGAVTRLNYLVDVANAAYVNSGIGAQVRLVHAMQVTYTDTNTNDLALEQLSGYKSGTGPVTPAAAFDALRAARETYGADLVSLVRDFQTPEQDGCGIAWLLGGSLQGIGANEGWDDLAYSVVDDGVDADTDGKNYFCLDETLAHELGHNMGAAHDRETAKGTDGVLDNPGDYGAYTYSFGYKTSAAQGDFYTIMAYGDTGQRIYRIFSDPGSTFCGGHACGNGTNADNARTLRQTIPVVSGFRSAVQQSPRANGNDVNGDSKSDVLFRKGSDLAVWLMNGSSVTSNNYLGNGGIGYAVVATGDFNADRAADVVWANSSRILIWINNGAGRYASAPSISYGGGWTPFQTADINNDGISDLLFRKGSGLAVWIMNGTSVVSTRYLGDGGTGYEVAAVGDFDGNGASDLAWINGSIIRLWTNNGAGAFTASPSGLAYGAGWTPFLSGDVNRDGKDDLLFRKGTALAAWMMSGISVASTAYLGDGGANFQVVASGDFNDDGATDLAWANGNSIYYWINNGAGKYLKGSTYYFGGGWVPFDPGQS